MVVDERREGLHGIARRHDGCRALRMCLYGCSLDVRKGDVMVGEAERGTGRAVAAVGAEGEGVCEEEGGVGGGQRVVAAGAELDLGGRELLLLLQRQRDVFGRHGGRRNRECDALKRASKPHVSLARPGACPGPGPDLSGLI